MFHFSYVILTILRTKNFFFRPKNLPIRPNTKKIICKSLLQKLEIISYLRLYRISNLHLDINQQVKYVCFCIKLFYF